VKFWNCLRRALARGQPTYKVGSNQPTWKVVYTPTTRKAALGGYQPEIGEGEEPDTEPPGPE